MATRPDTTSKPLSATPPSGGAVSRAGIAAMAAFVILVVVVIAVALAHGSRRRSVVEASTRRAAALPAVQVVQPQRIQEAELTTSGPVKPVALQQVVAPISGTLRQVLAAPGTRVHAGQLLAQVRSAGTLPLPPAPVAAVVPLVDSSRLHGNVQQARTTVALQKAAVTQAKAALATAQAHGTQAAAARAQADATLATAQVRLQADQAALTQAQAAQQRAAADSARFQDYYQQGLVSGQEADRVKATLTTATANVASAQAAENAAEQAVTAAQQNIASSEKLVSAASAEVATATRNLSAAQAALKSAEPALQTAAGSASDARTHAAVAPLLPARIAPSPVSTWTTHSITAPFDGIVTLRTAQNGAFVPAGSSLFEIARADTVRIPIEIPLERSPAVQAGARVQVTVASLPGKVFTGTIGPRPTPAASGHVDGAPASSVSGAAAAGAPLDVQVQNPNLTLAPGMTAQVKIPLAHPVSVVMVPRSALLIDGKDIHRARVAVVTPGGTVRIQSVEATARVPDSTLVQVTGLTGDEQLVNGPPASLERLATGARVRVTSTAGPG